MIKKIFVVILLFAAVSFAQLMNPKISLQQIEYDFGEISQGDVVSHTFILSNNGGDLLKIMDVKASCGCTAAKPDKSELKPGESTNLVVSFNSKGRKGPQTKTVTIKTNDPENPTTNLTIKGNVIVKEGQNNTSKASLYFDETQYNFGKVEEGKKVEHVFKFQNTGTESLVIKDIKTSCGCTAAVVDNKNLKPGQSGSLRVELDTKGRSGRMSRTVTIESNDGSQTNKILTLYAEVIKN